jgi:hypothetical protein
MIIQARWLTGSPHRLAKSVSGSVFLGIPLRVFLGRLIGSGHLGGQLMVGSTCLPTQSVTGKRSLHVSHLFWMVPTAQPLLWLALVITLFTVILFFSHPYRQ